MQERRISCLQDFPRGENVFHICGPLAAPRARHYRYVVEMDGMRYGIALRSSLKKADCKSDLLKKEESDFLWVRRDGRSILPDKFMSAYSHFFQLAALEPGHNISVYFSF
ncbi:MAG TPA: hypothetical protein PKJ97_02455 [Candidatus Bilamarchaeaceae archaeon]|nr:hypothetical protein [Candidatus Bilamarchaeaceae archaeon]